jgi:hypothetical protein
MGHQYPFRTQARHSSIALIPAVRGVAMESPGSTQKAVTSVVESGICNNNRKSSSALPLFGTGQLAH